MGASARRLALIVGALALLSVAGFVGYQYFRAATKRPFLDVGDREVVALGQTVYAQHCASCHGAQLQGQPDWKVRLPNGRLPAPPHDGSGHTWHHSGEQLFALTKFGPAALLGGDYQSDMPAFEGRLSDAEIIAALTYVKSSWPAEIQAHHDAISRGVPAQ